MMPDLTLVARAAPSPFAEMVYLMREKNAMTITLFLVMDVVAVSLTAETASWNLVSNVMKVLPTVILSQIDVAPLA